MAVKPRRCQRCQADIPLERLETLPETRLCVQCSQAVGSDFTLGVRLRNTGKSGSIKQTGTDIDSIVKVRCTILPRED